jgi:uncharacterized membrane protein YecN with MAPEG domain
MLTITSIYAALIAFLFLVLSFRVIAYRRGNQISLGDKGDFALLTRMRAQGNCAEFAPLALILLALTEMAGPPAIAVHSLGIMLLAGRVMHAVGFWGDAPIMRLRVWGTALTALMMAVAALGLLAHALT